MAIWNRPQRASREGNIRTECCKILLMRDKDCLYYNVCEHMWMNGCGNTHWKQGSMPFPTVYRNWSDVSEWLTLFPAGVWLHAFRVHCYRHCPTFIQYPCSHCYQFLSTCRYLQHLHVTNKLDNFQIRQKVVALGIVELRCSKCQSIHFVILTRRGMLVRMESGDWISTRPSLVLFSWAAENTDKNARLQYHTVLIGDLHDGIIWLATIILHFFSYFLCWLEQL